MACRSPGYYLPIKRDDSFYDPIRHKLISIDYNPYDFFRSPNSPKRVYGLDYLVAFSPEKIEALKALDPDKKGSEIPCGRCFGCRLNARKEMTYRLMQESTLFHTEQCWFLTLTYEDQYVSRGMTVDVDPHSGEVYLEEVLALNYDDLDKWRMRFSQDCLYHYGHSYRHFFCGEYGASTLRPHYHAIIFGLTEDELAGPREQREWWNQRKHLKRSDRLDKSWGKGRVIYAPACYEAMEYVAGYVLKKSIGLDKRSKIEMFYAAADLPLVYEDYRGKSRLVMPDMMIPFEKTCGSNRPGLGRLWYEQHKGDVYRTDEMLIARKGRLIRAKPVHYYDRLFGEEDPASLAITKMRRREEAEAAKAVKLAETGYTAEQLLELQLELDATKARESILRRGDTSTGHI